MSTTPLSILSDLATDTHVKIQQEHANINPVVGVSKNMRANGIPADVMTIDCLKSGKRIILILHDEQPEQLMYQFAYRDKDPDDAFQQIKLADISVDLLYTWIVEYFS
ncbi:MULTISPECIES: hypothetical protein [unclassified Oleiphilus]|nr:MULTISPECIES: hypothetical protein [unclassified Oleiphilus]KZY49872.1 hypothetical protein A3732_05160 [Oleiphilus sp. HI0050]KZY75068.1 hypothetical protein A3740_02595 [Oleiphilus sp. HI0068]KZY84207.1 hypothetical protein A3741_03415 [Oleiphilus sp. HI0069]KZY95669.1 hypothetical protein A3743_05230 [Oleiphilus sp. HI0072]KZZ09986.1 hypothetical protein A3749_12290 [Oleiphilus sp. HI0078]KZZ22251.1 hypothetical protein A3752_06945 [Oleiphilus sp. HI0081]KZZ33641.1 hypothetical protein